MKFVNLSSSFMLAALLCQCTALPPAIASTAKKAAELPATQESWTIISKSDCKISCIDPHANCEESEKVIDEIKAMYKAFSEDDIATLGACLDENCTTFDEGTQKLITGKKAVLEDIKERIAKGKETDSKLLSYTIDNPYAEVKGNTAIVTFTAIKAFGGKNPHTLESRCTDIFRKENGKWLRMHYRSNWQPVKA